jgi:hypothetical protein
MQIWRRRYSSRFNQKHCLSRVSIKQASAAAESAVIMHRNDCLSFLDLLDVPPIYFNGFAATSREERGHCGTSTF